MYYQEVLYEADDEICYSSQGEDSHSICSSSYESDANWEEERNDGSCNSYASRGMSCFLKFESELLVQNYAN